MTTITTARGVHHISAHNFLYNLHRDNPTTKIDAFQSKLNEITESATEDTVSSVINLDSLDIHNVICTLPKDGEKAIVVTRVYDDRSIPTKLKTFTGSEWHIDLNRIKGHIGNVCVSVDNIVVDLRKNKHGHWELTNVIPQPTHNGVSLSTVTQHITLSHLIGAITSASLISRFKKGSTSGYSLYSSTDDEEMDYTRHIPIGSVGVTMTTDAIMSCSSISTEEMSPVRNDIIPLPPTSIVLEDGEESKFGDGDRFAAYIASRQSIFSQYMKVFGPNREHFVIMIGKNGEEHLWTKCEEHWDTLIQCFANVCATTL